MDDCENWLIKYFDNYIIVWLKPKRIFKSIIFEYNYFNFIILIEFNGFFIPSWLYTLIKIYLFWKEHIFISYKVCANIAKIRKYTIFI